MKLHAYSASRIGGYSLPGPSAVVRIADEPALLAPIHDSRNVEAVLDLTFEDQDGTERAPTEADAKRIVEFYRRASENPNIEHFVAQCQAGVGRSVAVVAAISESRRQRWEEMAVYNRTLYRLMLAEFRMIPKPEVLVSISLRVKYPPEYLLGFLLSMRRQRYENWQVVAVTDGPRPDIRELLATCTDNVILVETPVAKGRWGHFYRQKALELCEGEWIGTNNDDNYLTPGYLEQMVMAGERARVPLVKCCGVHRYSAWGICKAGDDLACWLARKELVRQVPWDETDFWADKRYLERLTEAAGGEFAEIPRTLVVKN